MVRVCVRACVCVQHTGITASGRAVVAQVLTLIFTRLYTFTPRVIEFVIDFICAFPSPGSATTTASGCTSLVGAALGTPRGHGIDERGGSWFCEYAK